MKINVIRVTANIAIKFTRENLIFRSHNITSTLSPPQPISFVIRL